VSRFAEFAGAREFPADTRTAQDAAAAGTPRSVFPLAPDELVRRCGGRVERVSPGS
jgi:hypothetical protein